MSRLGGGAGPGGGGAPGAGAEQAQGSPYTERSGRVTAARRLTRRSARDEAGEFLAEGPQVVREALRLAATRPGAVRMLLGTDDALARHADLAVLADEAGVAVSRITPRAAAGLSETSTPQGVVAVCRFLDVPVATTFTDPPPALVAVLVGVREPGNAGAVLRSADAAGAGAVVLTETSVDPYNSKAVRASAGSLFHLPLVRDGDLAETMHAARSAGLVILAADAAGDVDLDTLANGAADGTLGRPTAWLFGNEAHGLSPSASALADARVRVPIHGRAESLNLAAAAVVCLYASARAQRQAGVSRLDEIASASVTTSRRAMS